MPRLIDRNGVELPNPWAILDKDAALETVLAHASDSLIVPLGLWHAERGNLLASSKRVTVWLDSDESADAIAGDLPNLDMIALNFPVFTDGRGYSTASCLRRHYAYEGEIRAIGDVLRDQLFYLRRCGFTTFDLKDSVKLEDARRAMRDFADNYQATVEQPLPLFRRRLETAGTVQE